MQIRKDIFLYIIIIVNIAFFTYFKGYQNPPKQFWDENYHIASAQKYIDGVFFLEPHPPLGKLFIALGEEIFKPNKNIDTSYFTKTNYIKHFPNGYSYKGMRFFPALFGWFNAVLFFIILYQLTKKAFLSFLGTFFYLFDNALIVHSRSAMLESTQLFFIFLSLIAFLYGYKKEKRDFKDYLLFTLPVALSVMVKLNSLVIIILYAWLFYKDIKTSFSLKDIFLKLITVFVSFFAVVYVIMFIHFSLAHKIVDHRTYGISSKSIQLLKENKLDTITGIKEYIAYMKRYEKTVPKYNPCKKGGDNGSLAMTWPIMDKCINYRWHKIGSKVQYLYLVGNPIIWLFGLLGIISSLILVGGRFLYGCEVKKEKFGQIFIFTSLYVSYMIAILKIDRVMYLYHYFIPLLFSLILAVLQIDYIFDKELEQKDKVFYLSLILLGGVIIFTFWFFSPFTYYHYLDAIEFNKRAWFDFWHLKAIR